MARDGTISTIAPDVPFRAPRNVAADAIGNLYVSDFESGSVYRINTSGVPSVVALLKFPAGLAIDHNGILFIGETGTHTIRKLEGGTRRTVATVQTPTGLTFDAQGTLYIGDASGGGIFRACTANTAAPLPIFARDIATGSSGVLYSTDGKQIRRITATSNIAGIAGHGSIRRMGIMVQRRRPV